MSQFVMISGSWTAVTASVQHAGTWEKAVGGWVRNSGVWKPFYSDSSGLGRFPARMGFNAHQVEDADVSEWGTLGIRHVRHTLYWNQWVANTGGYQTTFATSVGKLTAAGIRPLIVVHTAPTDLSATATTAQRTQFAQDFGAFVAARAAQFPGCDWQLWNEMDTGWTTAFGYGSGLTAQQQGALYGTHLSIVIPMIRAADPTAGVVTGGTGVNPQNWYTGVASTIGTALPDALAVHAYGEPPWYQVRDNSISARTGFGAAIPVWVTETGISTTGMSNAWGITGDNAVIERSRQMRQAMAAMRAGNIARVYWYVWKGNDGHEIIRADGTMEPAVDAFIEYSRNNTILYDNPGTYTFTVPSGVTTIRASAQGAGGGGQAGSSTVGIGGAGGSYAYGVVFPVSASNTISVTVGAGGSGGIVGGAGPTAGSGSSITYGAGSITTYGGGVGGAGNATAASITVSATSKGPGRGEATTNEYGANSYFGYGGLPGGVNAATPGIDGRMGAGGSAGSYSATAGLRANGGKGGDGFVLLEWGTLRQLPTLDAVITGYDAPNASNIVSLTTTFQNPNNRPGKVHIYWHGIGGTDEGGFLTSGSFTAGATGSALTHLRHQDFGTGNHTYRARVFFSLDSGSTFTDGPHPSANWANA